MVSEQQYIPEITNFFKTLGDESRLRIIYSLSNEEVCVTELAENLKMTQSAVSHQLKLLKLNGLVRTRREGQKIFYTLDDEHVVEIMQLAAAHIRHKINE